jgi:hypothetical protein
MNNYKILDSVMNAEKSLDEAKAANLVKAAKHAARMKASRACEDTPSRDSRIFKDAAQTRQSRSREDTPTRERRKFKNAASTQESRAKEDSPTRLARRSQDAASTQDSRAKEDTPTRLARQSEDSQRKKVKRSDHEQNLKEAGTRHEAREDYRVRVRGETHGMEQDPRRGQLAMYAATRTYEEVRNDPGQTDEDLLAPISIEEAAPLIRRYKEIMNPRSNIYTCASCGIRVILPEIQQPYKLPIRQLVKLKLSPHQIETFKHQYPLYLRRLRGVTACTNNEFYFLSRPHVDKACDNRTDTYPDEPISPDTLAFLCKGCHDCLCNRNPDKQKIPTFSLANGVDYSLAYI